MNRAALVARSASVDLRLYRRQVSEAHNDGMTHADVTELDAIRWQLDKLAGHRLVGWAPGDRDEYARLAARERELLYATT